MGENNTLTETQKKEVFEFFFRMGNLSKIISEECYNKNGKNNRDSITMPQFTTMQIIKYGEGDVILKDIAKSNCISKGALSIMLSKLEGHGLIKKCLDVSKDKRNVIIKLTPKGEKILEEKENETGKAIEKRFASLMTEEDINFVKGSFPKVIELLKKLESGGQN